MDGTSETKREELDLKNEKIMSAFGLQYSQQLAYNKILIYNHISKPVWT